MFNILIGNKTKKAMKVLGIESFPFTESELKSKFRKLANIHHPDKSNGDDSLMKKINAAYSHIKYLAIGDTEIREKGKDILKAEQENEDMFEFFESCKRCDGNGEITHYYEAYTDLCDRCMERSSSLFSFKSFPIGKIKVKCRDCRGTGKFKQRSGRTVTCRQCKGLGWLSIKCPKCKGTGRILIKARTTRRMCWYCGGSGKIKLNPFNPVIPKGGIL
ncbi:DnaJ domain-containing protein [candidate division WOR-3 bacterium]|nr:DnaJ domain-containing protein [candidate division WOR-3 bacterium]